ncbi:MAG: hypothetical protein H6935_09355 [Thiobacillus sp.]|nr:hypothetical protein [Thiobacillus sp.]
MARRTKVAAACVVCAAKIPPGSHTGGDVSITINLLTAGKATIQAPICMACADVGAADPSKAMAILIRAGRGVLGLEKRDKLLS